MEVVMKNYLNLTIKQAEKFVENKAVDKMIEHFEQINKA